MATCGWISTYVQTVGLVLTAQLRPLTYNSMYALDITSLMKWLVER